MMAAQAFLERPLLGKLLPGKRVFWLVTARELKSLRYDWEKEIKYLSRNT